ncbi:neuronal acetylcholine receptor subunit beta-4 [Biomphalaria glabrata]|nr:neuronal acetylcholine receptor subunit beta-4 [Biomphalaria glabrata]
MTSKDSVFKLVLFCTSMFYKARAQTYSDGLKLLNDKLSSVNYRSELRPLLDQTRVINVTVEFFLLSIVELSDVAQSFTANGFLTLHWTDEILAWDLTRYNQTRVIHPLSENIWIPKILLMNTLNERDIFADNKAPLFINSSGSVTWAPGSLFPTSCQLKMTKYPMDEQTCTIFLSAMTHSVKELRFLVPTTKVRLDFYTRHGEWDLLSSSVTTADLDTGVTSMSSVRLKFTLKRRPQFLFINILLPAVFLSFLNIMVFVIPVESGEKISYVITVQMALSVFLSMVSSMLPSSSLTMPTVIVYLFILLIISMLTVIDSIITVHLYHLETKEDLQQKTKEQFKRAADKVVSIKKIMSAISKPEVNDASSVTTATSTATGAASLTRPNYPDPALLQPPLYTEEKAINELLAAFKSVSAINNHVNKYKVVGQHVDTVSLVVFLAVWVAVTIGFFIDMTVS